MDLVYSLPSCRLYAMPTRATIDKGRVMTNYVVSIGRNAGSAVLDDIAWLTFRDDVKRVIKENDGRLHSIALGDGEYDGLVEETAVFVFEIADNGPTYRLEKTLGHIAYKFGQECIAWQEVKTVRFIAP